MSMKLHSRLLAIATLVLFLCDPASPFQACGSPKLNSEKFIKRHHETMRVMEIPSDHFWGDVNGTNYLTESRNQHIPQYCGSCWAHAAFSSIADRIKIANNGTKRDVIPSVQALINCGT